MELSPKPKVIMLTAFGHENITQRAVELGASYYILKPFNLEVLAERIRQLGKAPCRRGKIQANTLKNVSVRKDNGYIEEITDHS